MPLQQSGTFRHLTLDRGQHEDYNTNRVKKPFP